MLRLSKRPLHLQFVILFISFSNISFEVKSKCWTISCWIFLSHTNTISISHFLAFRIKNPWNSPIQWHSCLNRVTCFMSHPGLKNTTLIKIIGSVGRTSKAIFSQIETMFVISSCVCLCVCWLCARMLKDLFKSEVPIKRIKKSFNLLNLWGLSEVFTLLTNSRKIV
jgi:hypothetical protein